MSKTVLPAAVPLAGFALVVTAAAATAVVGPADRTDAAAALVVSENPAEHAQVSRDYVRAEVSEESATRPARAGASETGVKYANRDLKIRTAPNSSSAAVASLDEGDEVTVSDQTSRGFTLVLHEGAERWIWSAYLDDEPPAPEPEPASVPSSTADSGGSSLSAPSIGTVDGDTPGVAAVNAALSQVGTPYQYGARSPGVGFDCSGLTSWAYAQAGVSIPRSTGPQRSHGTQISRADLSPGDLIHSPGHVVMYIGNGRIVHAPSSGGHVEVLSMSSYLGWANPTAYTRPWS